MVPKLKGDLRSPEFQRNPYPLYDELRRDHPVYYDSPSNFWMVSRYADVCGILKNPAMFSSQIAGFEPTLLGGDPPVHTRARHAANPIFSTSRVAGWEDRIRMLARREIDRVLSRSSAEVIGDLFQPLQISIVSWIFGFDDDSLSEIQRWSGAFVDSGRLDLDGRRRMRAEQMMKECKLFMREHLVRRQRERDGWPITLLFDADDDRLSIDELVDVGLILLVGGYETTPKLMGNALITLASEPALLDVLRGNKELIPPFLEEVLRYDSTVQRAFRIAKQTVNVAGVDIPQGGRIVLLLGSANRDPAQFPGADQFRLDRNPNSHVTFGLGPHFCLGARLARLEAHILTEELVDRLPSVTLAAPIEDIKYQPSLAVRGPARLEVLFPASVRI